ncbi:MAG: hypothetical protein ABIJ75_02505 [Actinomycetota bacterium]
MANPRVGPHRLCQADDCRKRIPKEKNRNALYCSTRCRERVRTRRKALRKHTASIANPIIDAAIQAGPEGLDREQMITDFLSRRAGAAVGNRNAGPAYRAMMRNPKLLAEVMTGTTDYTTAGEILGFAQSTISKVMEQVASELRTDAAGANWSISDRASHLLGLDLDVQIGLGDILGLSDRERQQLFTDLTDRFCEWRDEICTDEAGNRYVTKKFHRLWIRTILKAIFLGRRQMILSPPRHGKTQLLIDFCIWLILRHPNIRILWVASNSDLAEDWLASIKDQLENNEKLRLYYLPPGRDFKPPSRSGKSWSRTQFTVDTRTVTGIKSPTMQAVGRNGRILSRDVDFMIVDDIEDNASTSTPGSLADTRKWFAITAGSRKEEHTGVVVIGSRQDPEDLYGHLIDNPEWSVIVTEAHSSACELDEYDDSLHVDCMLFPEKRSYKWLQQQRRSMALEGGDDLFEMVYLNRAIPRGLQVFDEKAMRKRIDPNRDIGQYRAGSLLAAGLDPSVAGHQSAFLWAYSQETGQLQMVDLVVDTGPGITGFLDILSAWTRKYPTLTEWVVEQNAFQRGYMTDSDVVAFRTAHGLHIQGHETQQNKWDPRIGVGAMARLYTTKVTYDDETTKKPVEIPAVTLPGGSREALGKLEVYIRQAKFFGAAAAATRGRSTGLKSDVLMASWFPMKQVRLWQKEWEAVMDVEYDQSYSDFAPTNWDEVPW